MQVANLELCRTLFELSGWGHKYHAYGAGAHDLTDKQWYSFEGKRTGSYWEAVYEEFHNLDPFDGRRPTGITHNIELLFPAYDLGYLLRKLTSELYNANQLDNFQVDYNGVDWRAYFKMDFGKDEMFENADNPEDAACKLAIELFKVGVLSREEHRKVFNNSLRMPPEQFGKWSDERLSQLLNRGGSGVAIDKSDVPTEDLSGKGEHPA